MVKLNRGDCMSTKRTKADKSQRQADQLEKRLDDLPDENEKKKVKREDSSQADTRIGSDASKENGD